MIMVPGHSNEDLGRGITSKIFKDIEMTKEDFLNGNLNDVYLMTLGVYCGSNCSLHSRQGEWLYRPKPGD